MNRKPNLFALAAAGLIVPAVEQHSIVIGNRNLQRGAMLRGAAAQRPQSQVTIAACGECGKPGQRRQDGVVIAQCSCGTGAARAFAAAPPSSVPTPGGMPGNYSANPFPDPMPGCYPRSLCDPRTNVLQSSNFASMLRASRMQQAPYVDPWYDWVWMDEILSDVTTVGAGLTVNVELQPEAGTFALFYYDIIAVDPTTQVQQVDWRAARPRIEGCPVPCSSGTTAALSQLIMKVPEGCCGQPLVAWIDEESRNTPLITPVTNNQAAGDLSVQIRGRGYCCNLRIC